MDHALKIGPKVILRDGPPLLMAELGVNHDGDPAKARQLIDAAAKATCDIIKFQLFQADLLLARDAGLVDYQKASAASAHDLLKPLELPPTAMAPLIKHAQSLGMAAVVTPFSPELVASCVEMGVDAIKLASPDLVNRPLIEEAARTGLPLILSTGAADLPEIERTVGWLWKAGAGERSILLHCVSSYPTPAEQATLAAITILRDRFKDMPIGYSDHTVETFTAALAVACGASVLEKHLTLDRTTQGPDHAASLEPAQMTEYCALARIGYVLRGPYAKIVQDIEQGVRTQTRQSIVVRADLPAGTVLTRDHVTVKRPGTGIPPADLDRVVGKTLAHAIRADTLLRWEDLA